MKRLSPAESAVYAQAMELVIGFAAEGVPVIFAGYPDDGTLCVWCDCPDSAGDEHRCAGCGSDAQAVLNVIPEPAATPGPWPVCQGHYADALRVLQLLVIAMAKPG